VGPALDQGLDRRDIEREVNHRPIRPRRSVPVPAEVGGEDIQPGTAQPIDQPPPLTRRHPAAVKNDHAIEFV